MPRLRIITRTHLIAFLLVIGNVILLLATGWRLSTLLQVFIDLIFFSTAILLIVYIKSVIKALKAFAGKGYIFLVVLLSVIELASLAFVALMFLVSVTIQRPDVRAKGRGHEIRVESRVFWPQAYALYQTRLVACKHLGDLQADTEAFIISGDIKNVKTSGDTSLVTINYQGRDTTLKFAKVGNR